MKNSLLKKIFILLVFNFLLLTTFGQSPEKLNYQAVIRDAGNELITSQTVGMQISILQGSASGTAVYVETQTPVTNANGLVSIKIGDGTTSDDFSSIDWSDGPYFLKTEADPSGGTSYTITGTSQLLSVPYALYAKTAESITGTINYTETQTISDVTALGNSVNAQLKNVTDPTEDQDAATKAYVDGLMDHLYGQGTLKLEDMDGNTYNTKEIGGLIWMTENLNTTKYNDGSPIPLVSDSLQWMGLVTPGYCWYHNDSATFGEVYGALYNWYTVNTGDLCPTGWRVPTHSEWTQLAEYLGGSMIAGGKLKETGTTHWDSPNFGATNETGFTALPGGGRNSHAAFSDVGKNGFWWSATEESDTLAWTWGMEYYSINLDKYKTNKEIGMSIRCVKDY